MDNCILIQTTFKEREQALSVAQILVKQGLVACAQIAGPITSVYRFEAKLCEEQEYVLMAKTFEDRWQAIEDAIKQHHPYQVPELIALPLTAVSAQYKEWMKQCIN